ncbi:glycosyltransferase family 4 protein [Oleiharenicola lentus]|uniref:glycosyltransferase family 4 protein n=1 Tax=Oleiharenicola lentus TaxID=2508720 RepID=UPI003F666C9A
MNLLFYVPAMAPYGGIERHLCRLAAYAAAHGHTVRFLTTGDSLCADLRRDLEHPNIIFRELAAPRGSIGPLKKIIWLLNELRSCRRPAWDVIYTNAQSGFARLVWGAAGARTRIIHHHHTSADAAEQKTWSRVYRHVLRHARKLVGCSKATCAAINRAVGRSDAYFLPYLAACPVAGDEVTEHLASPILRFGFCGRLIPEKGIDAILALAARPELADIEWQIHGAGDVFPPARFQGLARIFYHGAYRSLEAHRDVLKSLDAVVLFSTHNEGMPLCLIEAMSAGLPWIATDRGGTRELALSTFDSVVVSASADLEELARDVRLLADRIHSGATSRRRQRAHYETHFAPEIVAARWLEFFKQ